MTVVYGGNGEGKTNLIEAVCFLTSGGSPRPGTPEALVRDGAESALVAGTVAHEGRHTDIAFEIPRRGRVRAALNGDMVRRRSEALGHVRSVLFSPDDLALVKAGPLGRRSFLDETCTLFQRVAADRQAEFERVLRQRTSLLRSRVRQPTLDTWTAQLLERGMAVLEDRLGALGILSPFAEAIHSDLTRGIGKLSLSYRLSWGATIEPGAAVTKEEFKSALAAREREEVERGLCLVGPHRDDVAITLDGRHARLHASQGEARTIALALRLAVHAAASEAAGPPTLLLDDVLSELDPPRAEALLAHLPACQTIITTADPPERLSLPGRWLRLRVAGGTLEAPG